MITAEYLIEKYNLELLPIEGGMFRRVYLSEDEVSRTALPPRYQTDKRLCNTIVYLHQPHTESVMHRLPTDEIYHFYLGDLVTMLLLFPDGTWQVRKLGPDLEMGHELQVVVPRGVWQGSCLSPGGKWAFIACSMSPGYDDSDFELGDRSMLLAQYPAVSNWIRRLTPDDPTSLLARYPEKAKQIRLQKQRE